MENWSPTQYMEGGGCCIYNEIHLEGSSGPRGRIEINRQPLGSVSMCQQEIGIGIPLFQRRDLHAETQRLVASGRGEFQKSGRGQRAN